MNARSAMTFGAVVTALLVLLVFITRPGEAQTQNAVAPPAVTAFARSMEGTRPDGDIKVDGDDTLQVDAELGRLFDYYLAGQGERSLADIRSATEAELDRRLKPGAAKHAKRLLAQYWLYKEALAGLDQKALVGKGGAAALRARMVARSQLRARFFSSGEVTGLFGFDDAYDADAIARLEVEQDKTLDSTQKRTRLAALDAALTPALREEREAPRRVLKLEETAQAMRRDGASEDDIYRMRATQLTPEAATRLAEVDREEAAWKGRIAAYLAQRKQIMETNAPDLPVALAMLRGNLFSDDEQRRLVAYE